MSAHQILMLHKRKWLAREKKRKKKEKKRNELRNKCTSELQWLYWFRWSKSENKCIFEPLCKKHFLIQMNHVAWYIFISSNSTELFSFLFVFFFIKLIWIITASTAVNKSDTKMKLKKIARQPREFEWHPQKFQCQCQSVEWLKWFVW